MIHPYSARMLAAVLALAGFYLLKLGIVSFAVALIRIGEGNPWALLLVPVTVGSLHFAIWALRNAAAEIPRH